MLVLWRDVRRVQANAAARRLLQGCGAGRQLLVRTASALLTEVLTRGRPASCKLILSDGRRFRLLGRHVVRGPKGQAGAVCKLVAAPAARARAPRRQSALETLPHPVWQLSGAGQVIYANPAARRLMAHGGPAAEQEMATCWPLLWIHPDERASVEGRWQAAMAQGGPLHVRCRLNLPPGRGYRWFVVRAQPQVAANAGGPTGWVVTVQDEHENHEMREDLRTAACVRSNFLRVASHELSTPLTSLQLALQLACARIGRLQAGPTQLAPVAEPLHRALADTRRLVELVSDLLDIKRLQAGKFFLRRSRVELGSLLRDMLARLDKPFRDAGCTLDFRQDDSVEGEWDVVRLQQVFFHLLHNVIKYAPGSPLHVRCGVADGNAYVAVEDEGPGIPAGLRKKIFSLFERATEVRGTSGLGLGLYLCRRIVHAHHGHLRLICRQGKGAKFVVSLPQVEPAAQQPTGWHKSAPEVDCARHGPCAGPNASLEARADTLAAATPSRKTPVNGGMRHASP